MQFQSLRMSNEGGAEFSDFLEFLASKVRARQSELGGHQICNQLYTRRICIDPVIAGSNCEAITVAGVSTRQCRKDLIGNEW